MPDSANRPASGLLTRTLKSIGQLTSPETTTGRAVSSAEERLSVAIDKVMSSRAYLKVTGALLRRGALIRSRRAALLEKALHTARMPTSTEVDAMRDQVRRLSDQVEAMGSQLERVARLLERQDSTAAEPRKPEPSRAKAPVGGRP